MIVNYSSYHIFGSGSCGHYSRILHGSEELTLTVAAGRGLIALGAEYDDGGNGFVGFIDRDVWATIPGLIDRDVWATIPGLIVVQHHWGDPGPDDCPVETLLPVICESGYMSDTEYLGLLSVAYAGHADWHLAAGALSDWLMDRGEDAVATVFHDQFAQVERVTAAQRQYQAEKKAGEEAWRSRNATFINLVERHAGRIWTPCVGWGDTSEFLCDIAEERKSEFCRAAHRSKIVVSRSGHTEYCYRLAKS